MCGTLVSRKKRKELFKSKQNHEFDKAEMSLYEEVTLMKPFRRKTLVLIGASGAARRSLKNRILQVSHHLKLNYAKSIFSARVSTYILSECEP